MENADLSPSSYKGSPRLHYFIYLVGTSFRDLEIQDKHVVTGNSKSESECTGLLNTDTPTSH